MLSIVICFLLYLLFNAKKSTLELDEEIDEKIEIDGNKVIPAPATESLRVEEVNKIKLFFENSDLYLQANFTLEDMSVEVDIPRAILTDVMNKEMQTGFYAILGEHRIHHAKKMLLDKENFTIEALVFQCGFHSKSTFNKYFKQFVGQTPSSFRIENMHNIRTF
ncbi:helix-turn-helix domain-containing protein [Flavobacterium sp. HSC-61S13]|uniref:helix-turn-helix domain-containing protein n=1 Tax=Flavobacterium sp. HSC-61S13 TaxID=2910963 RepID=UPI00209D353E|nr:helix-turn-helix domain-containing protein [Flavobacterium sp. HSC-61S13]MCP1997500.1 AraC-like DNA-binding protein [Flavobacterium sp. HSC-61S13]